MATEATVKYIEAYAENEGTDFNCALRDILTDIYHICEANGIDVDERLQGAKEVYIQEIGEH